MDTEEITKVIETAIDTSQCKNGKNSAKGHWARMMIQIIVLIAIALSAYHTLRGDVDSVKDEVADVCLDVEEDKRNLANEIVRSTGVDKEITQSVEKLNLEVNTIGVRQEVQIQQQEKLDDKMDILIEKVSNK